MKTILPIALALVFTISCGDNSTETASDDSTTKEDSGVAKDSSQNNNTTISPMTATLNDPPSVFYWNYDTNKGIESPEALTKEETIKLMNELPDSDRNFLGMKLADESIVQFMYQDGRGLVLDMPTLAQPVDKVISLEDCIHIIESVFAGKSADDIAEAY